LAGKLARIRWMCSDGWKVINHAHYNLYCRDTIYPVPEDWAFLFAVTSLKYTLSA
jgi:hypothetical protein